jgi:hypothetical protein
LAAPILGGALLVAGCQTAGPASPAAPPASTVDITRVDYVSTAEPTAAAQPGGADGVAPAMGDGPGISVEELLSTTAEGPYLVNGHLLGSGDAVVLCDMLGASRPPMCESFSVFVRGVDMATMSGVSRDGEYAWTEDKVQLMGDLNGNVFTVSGASQG